MTEADGDQQPQQPDRRRSRRRGVLLGAGGVALLLVVALVAWLATRGDEPTTTTPGPGPSASSGTGSATASASPTTSGGGSATAAPTGSTGSDSGAGTTSATEDRDAPVPTAIPADLTLPAEGQEGWTSAGWSYQPCGTQVSAAGASDFRRITNQAPESSGDQSLLVFATADEATAFLSGMRAAAEACAGPGDPGADVPAVVVGTLDGGWDDSLSVVQSYPVPEGGYGPGGDYTLAVRSGTAVAVSGGYAEWPPGYPTPDPTALAEYRAALDELAPRLCVFTDAGC